PRLPRQARGHDDEVASRDRAQVAASFDQRVVAADGAGLEQIERLPPGDPLDDIDERDIAQLRFGEVQRGGRTDVPRADDADLRHGPPRPPRRRDWAWDRWRPASLACRAGRTRRCRP